MKKIALGIALIVGLFQAAIAGADQKSYVWTYEYQTLPKGGVEVEYWLTMKTKDTHQEGDTDYQHQIELEYGITDKWDIALYQKFGQEGSDSLKYEGFKVETRYRLGERGKYFVDPLLYLEFASNVGERETLEGKLILAKDIGKLNIAYNQIAEVELGEGKVEHEYAVGASYLVHHSLRVGIEGKGSYTEREHAIGPTLSWNSGRFWAALGAAFGLNERTDDRQVRLIVGIPF
ncbi:MAG: hypothetical protein U0411_00635 [Thermodesulfovibrionales bacterium]